MRFSEAFDLHKTQAQLDFVDVELDGDTPLFLDPFALSIRKDAWSYECTQHLLSFFQAAIDAIHAEDVDRARHVLSHLSEPNETRLGLSKAEPSGRGLGGKQELELYDALVDSEAARTGILSEIAECDLFIPGISHDKISDITTNVIRGPLATYTREQCALLGVPVREDVPVGRVWDIGRHDWVSVYGSLPIWQGHRILLVPKASVRYRMCLDSQEYYNHFMLNFLQAEHLRSSSSLVKVLRNGNHVVTKKSVKERHPFSKRSLYEFTKEHPEVLEHYKHIKSAEGTLSERQLDEAFDEAALCDALSAALRQIRPGNDTASAFHNLMVGTLEFIFFPHLIYPIKEREIHEGRKRIDIVYTNAARDGFFYRLHTARQVASNYIMVECKNYSSDIGNEEVDQLSGRFSTNRGRLGISVSRSFNYRARLIERCRDTARDGRGFIIPLVDEDIHEMLAAIKDHRRSAVDARLDRMFNDIVS
jgi:hypothetical protein